MRIIAVVVTYNRLLLLQKTIDSLRNQTHNIDEIVIVNNSSTDGTEVWLNKQQGLTVIKQDNSGGSGGFNTGVKYAYENGADWIWVMDDDVFPNLDCLEILLKYISKSLFLIPRRFFSDGIEMKWEHLYSLKNNKRTPIVEEDSELITVNTGCFEGAFFSKEIVSKIGFPDKRFFISYDDTIYGYLASKYTTVYLVKNAQMIRAKKSTDMPLSSLFLYYDFRNFHIVEEYYKKEFGKNGYPLSVKFAYFRYALHLILAFIVKGKYKNNRLSFSVSTVKGLLDCLKNKVYSSY